MPNRLPKIDDKHKICIICEGPEEYEYLDKLKSMGIWNQQYDVKLVPADGNGNIPARYQDSYQNGSYEAVLVFCDTDRKPYEQYIDIKRKINEFHGVNTAADQVVIFGNPCTLQIVLQHFDFVMLKSQAKKLNAPLIEQYTGVKDYRAKKEQRKAVFQCITAENYRDMCKRVKKLSLDDNEIGSSNFDVFMEKLESDDAGWIEEINSNV